jgi:hypothetical protein
VDLVERVPAAAEALLEAVTAALEEKAAGAEVEVLAGRWVVVEAAEGEKVPQEAREDFQGWWWRGWEGRAGR